MTCIITVSPWPSGRRYCAFRQSIHLKKVVLKTEQTAECSPARQCLRDITRGLMFRMGEAMVIIGKKWTENAQIVPMGLRLSLGLA